MSSNYLCGTMSFLSEKESLANWEQCGVFSSEYLPADATAHSLDYLTNLVAARRRQARRLAAMANGAVFDEEKEQEEHQQQQLDDEKLNENNDDDQQRQEQHNFAFQLAEADEATLDMIVREEEQEELENLRRHQEMAETLTSTTAASAAAQDEDASSKTAGSRRGREADKTNNNSDEATIGQDSAAGGGGFGLSRRDARRLVDVNILAVLLNFQPGTGARHRGRIKTFLADQGYGFVHPLAASELAERKRRFDEERNARQQQQEQEQQQRLQEEKEQNQLNENGNASDEINNEQQQQSNLTDEEKMARKQAETQRQLLEAQRKKDERFFEAVDSLPLPLSEVELYLSIDDVHNLCPVASTTTAASSASSASTALYGSNLGMMPTYYTDPMTGAIIAVPPPPPQNPGVVATGGGDGSAAADPISRALRTPCAGEEVEFSVVVAHTQHGRSLRAVQVTGPNATPLIVQMPSMRQRGVVRLWDTNRRFGFLTPISGAPSGLAHLEPTRLPAETVTAMRKSGDVFMLASSVIWDPNVPAADRALQVGSVVEYTAVLRRNDPTNKNQQQSNQQHGEGSGAARRGAGGRNNQQQQEGGGRGGPSRIVAMCVTDFAYRPVDPVSLERTVDNIAGGGEQQRENNQQNQQNQQHQASSTTSSFAHHLPGIISSNHRDIIGAPTSGPGSVNFGIEIAARRGESGGLAAAAAAGSLVTARPGLLSLPIPHHLQQHHQGGGVSGTGNVAGAGNDGTGLSAVAELLDGATSGW